MKVLFMAPRIPLPADTGGKIRTWNLLLQSAQTTEVDLVCFSFDKNDESYVGQIKEKGINVTLVPINEDGFLNKVSHVLFSKTPYSVDKYFTESMKNAVQRLIAEKKYDLVHIDHIHMAHYRDYVGDIPCFLDEHNVEYRILQRCSDVEQSPIKKLIFSSQAKKMRRFECRYIQKFKACSGVSDDDSALLKELSNGRCKVHVLPNGVDTNYFHPGENVKNDSKESSVVFTGSMDWLPNNDSAIFFAKEILPIIWQKKPDVRFYVVGKSPSSDLVELAKKDQRIQCTGRVDDVRDYVWQSQVFVVPLRIGGGTRLKILEAMSMEKGVVSTTIGAEGINYKNHANINIADTANEIADAINYILDNPEKAAQLGKRGRELVLEEYDWNIVGRKLRAIYEEIING